MTRNELSKRIARRSGITPDAVDTIIQLTIEEIKKAVNRGEPVTLRTFGTFFRHRTPPKRGNNISKGIPVAIPARHTPKFKPGKTWKQELINSH